MPSLVNKARFPGGLSFHCLEGKGETIRSVVCNIVCNNCAQCDAHTYEQTNSSLDWVLSHWVHFTVLKFIFVLCITVCCMHA